MTTSTIARAVGRRRISLRRAQQLADAAVERGWARTRHDGAYELGPSLRAALAQHGTSRLTELDEQAASVVEARLGLRRDPAHIELLRAAHLVQLAAQAQKHTSPELAETTARPSRPRRGVRRTTIAR